MAGIDLLLARILGDPALRAALREACRRGWLSAAGQRIKFIAADREGPLVEVRERIGDSIETIPAEDWGDAQLFETAGELRLEGCRELLTPGIAYQPFAWAHVRFNAGQLRRFAEDVLGRTPADQALLTRGRGPRRGHIDRFAAGDRRLFSGMQALIAEGRSTIQAARELAEAGKVDGAGNADSRARRLARRYLRERGAS
jgi:hypothetical protein